MDVQRVDDIVKFSLAFAAQADDRWDRELGPIHLIKYVYLADLAYAQRHGGQSFTGATWRFYHYGPWEPSVLQRVLAVVALLHAGERVIETRYDRDSVRYFLADRDQAEDVLRQADRALPPAITSALTRAVREFGRDTTGLLHHVYSTRPMLRAAPGEPLEFSGVEAPPPPGPSVASPAAVAPSAKQQKREKERMDKSSERLRAKLAERRALRESRAAHQQPAPRFDEVYEEGRRWLDAQEGAPLEPGEFEVEISDEVWKDPWRSEPDAP